MKTTRYEFRFTTNPADFGYDGKPSNWRNSRPDARGSIRTILANADRALRSAGCGGGSGTMYNSEYRETATGKIVDRHDIQMLLSDMDYDRMH